MLLHQYDTQTGQYVSSFLADPDPINAGRWIEPAFTTPVPLPDRPRLTWPVFKDGAWLLVPDYRALMLYRKGSGAPAEILVIGITPDDAGLTGQPRPSDEYSWSEQAGAWVLDPSIAAKRARDAAMQEFEARLSAARQKNAGKADAYAAGMMTSAEAAEFKVWAAYQMELVRTVGAANFPDGLVWPAEPDEAAVAAQVAADEAVAAERAAIVAAAAAAAIAPPPAPTPGTAPPPAGE